MFETGPAEAHDLTPGRFQGDENYEIALERIPLSRFDEWISAGRLVDARVIAALYLARGFLDRQNLMQAYQWRYIWIRLKT